MLPFFLLVTFTLEEVISCVRIKLTSTQYLKLPSNCVQLMVLRVTLTLMVIVGMFYQMVTSRSSL